MSDARAVTSGGRRADLGGVYFRSTWEANWGRYLRWLVEQGQIASWEYEPCEFEFPIKRGARFYKPDFRVTENSGEVAYHEIKGFMDRESATKLARMGRYHPAVKVIVVDKPAYRAVAMSAGRLIEGWEQ